MSEQEPFLARWARRKREVAKEEAPEALAPDAAQQSDAANADKPPSEPEPPAFDPATLPSIDSINALSDVRAFLQKGVPADLTRAALRRVWTADPAIRDFVGLAENAWDFTDPNAMPGFGPLEASDEVRRMIAEVVDQIGQAAKPVGPATTEGSVEEAENSNHSNEIIADDSGESTPQERLAAEEAKQNPAQVLGGQVLLQSDREDIAMQHDLTEEQEKPKQFTRRTHGGALPE